MTTRISALDFVPARSDLYLEPAQIIPSTPDTLPTYEYHKRAAELSLVSRLVVLSDSCVDERRQRVPTIQPYASFGPDHYWQTDLFESAKVPIDPHHIREQRIASFRGVLGGAIFRDIDSHIYRLDLLRAEQQRRSDAGIVVPSLPGPKSFDVTLHGQHYPITAELLRQASNREIDHILNYGSIATRAVATELLINRDSKLWHSTQQAAAGPGPQFIEAQTREAVAEQVFSALDLPLDVQKSLTFPTPIFFEDPRQFVGVMESILDI